MLIHKKYITIVVLLFLTSCAKKFYHTVSVNYTTNLSIDDSLNPHDSFAAIIIPYKTKMENEMNRVITYAPVDLHKTGYNSPLANLTSDILIDELNLIKQQFVRINHIDICLLNQGGMRRTFSAGPITVGNIYELMPFDNEAVIVNLKGEQVREMVDFLLRDGKGHPISGLKTEYGKIYIQGELLDDDADYNVVTSDYLLTGGDEMYFLEKNNFVVNTDMKIRDIFLNYFEKTDTIKVNLDERMVK